MFVICLRFGANKARAGEFMAGHNEWIDRGFADGVFLVVGGLQPQLGGAILAHNTSRSDLEQRVAADPFMAQGVVEPEILEISPARADERLQFLVG